MRQGEASPVLKRACTCPYVDDHPVWGEGFSSSSDHSYNAQPPSPFKSSQQVKDWGSSARRMYKAWSGAQGTQEANSTDRASDGCKFT